MNWKFDTSTYNLFICLAVYELSFHTCLHHLLKSYIVTKQTKAHCKKENNNYPVKDAGASLLQFFTSLGKLESEGT